ncbi:MAG: hypothetical protein ACOZCO_12095 [Bacteroidota bacterium]
MKNIRALLLGLVAVFALNTAMAGEEKTNEMKAKDKTKTLTAQVGLTAEQVPQVEALYLEGFNKLDQVKAEKTTVTNEDKQAIIAEQEAKLKTILSEEQWAKYESVKARRAEKATKVTTTTK